MKNEIKKIFKSFTKSNLTIKECDELLKKLCDISPAMYIVLMEKATIHFVGKHDDIDFNNFEDWGIAVNEYIIDMADNKEKSIEKT